MRRTSAKNHFTYATFSRAASNGRSIVYVRFIDTETGEIIATRSTGKETEKAAKPKIAALLAELDLKAMAKAKDRVRTADLDDEERLAALSVYDFVNWFWSDDSYYIVERKDAGRPLSREYVETSRSYIRTTIKSFDQFQITSLKDIHLSIIEAFVRKLRRAGKSRDVIKRNIDAIRTPLNWSQSRGLVESPFDFKSIVLPEKSNHERGILTDEEIQKIVVLPHARGWSESTDAVQVSIRPRTRLKGKNTHEGPPMLDMRQKAAILFALFAGLRRGEIRGLRWGDIDMETKQINVQHNFVRFDGDKAPKSDSTGILPIAPELEPVLRDLLTLRSKLGYSKPEDFVLPGTSRKAAVSDITLRRGWERALEAIGIDEEQRKRRNLVMHGARHSYTTRLIDSGELTPAEVAKLTRHKDLTMLSRYGGHLQPETIEKGRRALSMKKSKEDCDGESRT
jgi:integrase